MTDKPEPFEPSKLPAAGTNRFWRITHDKQSRSKPVRVTLMQRLDGTTSNKFSHPLNHDLTIAVPGEIYETAAVILDRVGRIDEVVGDFE